MKNDNCAKATIDSLLRNKEQLLEEKKEYNATVKSDCESSDGNVKALGKLCILFDATNFDKTTNSIVMDEKVIIAAGSCPIDLVQGCAGQARASNESGSETTSDSKDGDSSAASSQQGSLRSVNVSFVLTHKIERVKH